VENSRFVPSTAAISSDWKGKLPTLSAGHVTLRELRLSDAESLLTMLTTEEVSRFILTPPTTIEGIERFIIWAHSERAAGKYVCFAIVPTGSTSAVGILQMRQLEPRFTTAEWGFALGPAFWGTDVFATSAKMMLDFAFDVVGVHRMEARSAIQNGRGNGALRKIGAVCEGRTRSSLRCNGEFVDQHLWSILDTDWQELRCRQARITVH